MKLRRVKNQTPHSSPPSRTTDADGRGYERFVWEVLVPRLLRPSELTFIQTLLKQDGPLPPSQLARAADITVEDARTRCASMQEAGVIEGVTVVPRVDGNGDEPSFYFSDRAGSSPSGFDGPRSSFRARSERGEIRGEVDHSALGPMYAVQHCVVDTYSGQVVLPPTHDEDRAQELAARLNQASDHEVGPGMKPDRLDRQSEGGTS